MKLSIFIITRKRTKGLKNLLDSIYMNCKNPSEIEVIAGIDSDDDESREFLDTYGIDKVYVNELTEDMWCENHQTYHVSRLKDLLHPMTQMSTGEYLWILNDDVEIRTKNFDLEIDNRINSFLEGKFNRVAYCKVNEIFSDPNRGLIEKYRGQFDYACYPLITRELYDILGFFMPIEFSDDGADIALASIMSKSLYNRFCCINNVTVYDNITESPSNDKVSRPHKSTYGSKQLFRDITKLDNTIKDAELESVECEYTYIKLGFKCKGCENQILLGKGLFTNMVTCNRCNTRNLISKKSMKFLNQLHMIEPQIMKQFENINNEVKK